MQARACSKRVHTPVNIGDNVSYRHPGRPATDVSLCKLVICLGVTIAIGALTPYLYLSPIFDMIFYS